MNQLLVKPISWSSVNPSISGKKGIIPSIQIFGYTSDYRTVYIRIPRQSTFILRFATTIDDEMKNSITEILNPLHIKTSTINSEILIVRAPELSPIELTSNPDFEELATWIEAKQDPYGELESFWEARDISPYEWIIIEKYAPIPGKYTSCDLNIRSEEEYISNVDYINLSDINLPEISPRLFFWDIETFASRPGEFPDASNPDDSIFMISIITVSSDGANGYVIVKGNLDQEAISKKLNMEHDLLQVVIIRVKDEKELLSNFFAIYNISKPDRQVYYNGDTFDMSYLIDRSNINGLEIPKISKILTLTPRVVMHEYSTPFGREYAKTLTLPGTEIIDLLHYYRRFYPYLRSHRLDSVATNFLGKGKTDLTIEEMMAAVRSDDLSKVVDYSYVDSLRLFELWNSTLVANNLETVCNNLGVDTDTLLHKSLEHIIDRSVYNIDAGTSLIRGDRDTPKHLKEATPGIYRNVFIYDYSELYRKLLIDSEQSIAIVLGHRLEGAPPKLILEAFYSPYVDRRELMPLLDVMLDSVLGTNMIIALEPTLIRSIGPLNAEWLKVINTSLCYVSVAKASYIILDGNNELETAGLAKLCRPQFELASDIIHKYLGLVYINKLNTFVPPDIKILPREKFILSEKISNIMNLKSDTLKYKLASQYGADIATWVSVKYLMTLRGPILISSLKEDDEIDYNYYMNELGKYMKSLQSLKIYGV